MKKLGIWMASKQGFVSKTKKLQFRQKPIPCNFFTVPVPLPFGPIEVFVIATFPLQRKQSMKTSVPIRIHNRPDNVLCQPRLQCQYAYTIDWTMFYASLDRELSYLLQQESSINMQQYNRSIILLSE